MPDLSSETLHASCVSIDGHAVLIEGDSGTGKSDLALRLIDRGAMLVSDDYTLLARNAQRLFAAAPATIAGKIEVRGIGIVDMPHVDHVPVGLIVALSQEVERMPPEGACRQIAGINVPLLTLDPHQLSTPIKVELALKQHVAS
jgi:serine kinase of HPr protein (carbohydrate metabolism regulator)